ENHQRVQRCRPSDVRGLSAGREQHLAGGAAREYPGAVDPHRGGDTGIDKGLRALRVGGCHT
ncbi:unnamed protein product, partial [Effrenium voratum]